MTKFVRKTREERMLEIRETAIDIFLEKGYRATTMEDIVNSLNLSRGSLYNYYPSKALIITDILKEGIHVRNRIISEYMKNRDNSIEDISKTMSALFFSDESNGKYAKIYVIFLYEKSFDKELESVYEGVINYGMENTMYLDVVDNNKLMQIMTMMNTLIVGKFILDKEFDTYLDSDLISSFFYSILDSD